MNVAPRDLPNERTLALMSTDAELVAGRLLVSRIRDAFSAEAALVDRRLQGDGFVVEEAPHIWIS